MSVWMVAEYFVLNWPNFVRPRIFYAPFKLLVQSLVYRGHLLSLAIIYCYENRVSYEVPF